MPARSRSPDPFSSITSPPPNETAEQRADRVGREAEARARSHAIDEEIREERTAMRRREKEVIKVLLLGQAESGKSTTLKNFRMKYAREAWKAERSSWRAVVLLNVVKAMLNVLNALLMRLSRPSEQSPPQSPPPSAQQSPINGLPPPQDTATATPPDTEAGPSSPTIRDNLEMSPPLYHPPSLASIPGLTHSRSHPLFELTPTHSRLIDTLYEPLLALERELKEYLGPASEEVGEFGPHYNPRDSPAARAGAAGTQEEHMQSATPFDPPVSVSELGIHGSTLFSRTSRSVAREAVEKRRIASGFLVRSWPSSPTPRTNSPGSTFSNGHTSLDLGKVSAALTPLVDDMSSLWEDASVKELVRKRKIRIEDGVEFFLTDLARVTSSTYVPTDDDVVRCRLRTTGVTEYPLYFHNDQLDAQEKEEEGDGQQRGAIRSKFPKISFGKEWIMYDVGGARTNRYAWQPYFENVHSIIFLAPISCFDERLLEDSRINRLEDSFLLWKSIVSSQFFVKTTMVVFLNKVDILKKKLENGLVINKYLPSFGPRDNDLKTAVKYLRDKFREMAKQYSPFARVVYLYTTSVIDTKATAQTLKSVRDGILREHLMSAELA